MPEINTQLPKSFKHNGSHIDIYELLLLPLPRLQGMITPDYLPENELILYLHIVYLEAKMSWSFENKKLHHVKDELRRALYSVQRRGDDVDNK